MRLELRFVMRSNALLILISVVPSNEYSLFWKMDDKCNETALVESPTWPDSKTFSSQSYYHHLLRSAKCYCNSIDKGKEIIFDPLVRTTR
jgi:hypothetical protein